MEGAITGELGIIIFRETNHGQQRFSLAEIQRLNLEVHKISLIVNFEKIDSSSAISF